MATVHPSSLLRIEDDAERKAAIRAFVIELREVAEVLSAGADPPPALTSAPPGRLLSSSDRRRRRR